MPGEGKLTILLRKFRRHSPADYAKLHIRELSIHSSIAFYEFGDPHGRPLLCLHGLSLSGLCFDQYHQIFLELGVRAIAPNLLGGIYSASPGDTIDTLTSRLLELLSQLKVQEFDMIGFSWGTLIQLSLLARAPDRVRKAGLLGAMLPVQFWPLGLARQLKPDVRTTLDMVKSMPAIHRILMWLIARLPVSVLANQFRDAALSAVESAALRSDHPFFRNLVRCMNECMRTGSRFLTDGWQMLHDQPAYQLVDMDMAGLPLDVRFYIAERDNVHLPQFSAMAAAAFTGLDADRIAGEMALAWSSHIPAGSHEFHELRLQTNCSLWLLGGTGRMACMVYFGDALRNLILE